MFSIKGVSLPLEFPDTVKAIKMGFKIQCTSLNNIIIPDTRTIRTIGKNNLRWRLNVSGLFEWIGMASIQSDRIVQGDKIDPYLCVYSNPPQANANETPIASRACLIEITGLIPAPSVLHIFELLRSVLNESSPDPELMPEWANFTVWGFQDSPISWRGKEHGHLISGENMYSFFLWSSNISPQGKEHPDTGVYVMFENVAAHDLHS
ncbi:Ribonuclease P protein subunit p40 [Lobosporangium transversale]|nr:Ribonuclease P protein subunit p40 [Lobosporangium transversale]